MRELAFDPRDSARLSFVFVDEPTLQKALNGGLRFSETELRLVALQLFNAMAFLHLAKLVHGNLCLETLSYAPSGQLRLRDWFWGRMLPMDAVRLASGPEVTVLGKTFAEIDRQSDSWNMGVVLATLMLERPFIQGATVKEQMDHTVRMLGKPLNWPEFAVHLSKFEDKIGKENLESLLLAKFGRPNGPLMFEFLSAVLRYNPTQRMKSDRRLLSLSWFHNFFPERHSLPPWPGGSGK